MTEPFVVKDCLLSVIATGITASSLPELASALHIIPSSSIYYHFWGSRLRFSFEDPEYQNDFAYFVFNALHDQVLAERLSILNPTDFGSTEELRNILLEIIEERLDEMEIVVWKRMEQTFHFLHSKIIVIQTPWSIHTPQELKALLPQLSFGSIFYHFIDARTRTENLEDDFSQWLRASNTSHYEKLIHELQSIDLYFLSLNEVKNRIITLFDTYLEGTKT